MTDSLYEKAYNPDVLTCIANLSNDEVFTPPSVANAMLDLLPQEIFSDPEAKFLDPACKSGVFLREIAKRLLEGLKDKIPDLQERINHIFKTQLYGIAITELTSLLSRRSVYCSKYPNCKYSVTQFDNPQGNIFFNNTKTKHLWINGKCLHCGASQKEYGDEARQGLERHAYQFIHNAIPGELENMKFDVIIGNPPYQLSDGGAQASAKPLYHLFVNTAEKLNPQYIVMVIPARWYAGGKGLDEFRNKMLNSNHLSELHDFPNTDDCFPGVNIRGGVCYFLWSKDKSDKYCKVITHLGKEKNAILRTLKYKDCDIFIRNGKAISILDKIESANEKSFSSIVSVRKPFGISTDFSQTDNFHVDEKGLKEPVCCYGKGYKKGFVEKKFVTSHLEWISRYKIFTSRANNIGTELNDDNLNTVIGKPNEICTESYIVIGADQNFTEKEINNVTTYLHTRFVRFCHSLAKASQDATSKTYRFVPLQDFSKSWTDEELYAKYNLSKEEITFIESMIRPME